jgi:hypothetical protein
LRPDELIDLAEGTRAAGDLPHAQTCDLCRRQLADLRAALGLAAQPAVPEPSPLFWDHLSARVRRAVAAEGAPGRATSWRERWRPAAAPVWAGAAAALAVAIVLTVRVGAPTHRRAPMPQPVVADGSLESSGACCADDPALALVADLVRDMDDTDAGALETLSLESTTHPGSADEAVSGLTTAEREELQRLLAAEMKRPGD